jgi:hypothetical protein
MSVSSKAEHSQALVLQGIVDQVIEIWTTVPNQKLKKSCLYFLCHFLGSAGELGFTLLVKDGKGALFQYFLNYLNLSFDNMDLSLLALSLSYFMHTSKNGTS